MSIKDELLKFRTKLIGAAEVESTLIDLDAKVDDEVTFDKVLYVEGEKVVVGKPYIEGAIVKGKVVKNLSRRFEAEQYDPQRVRAAAYWHAK